MKSTTRPFLLLIATLLCLVLASGPAHAWASLDVSQWLAKPRVKLVAVEFYATWCKPCMRAVPKWKKLHEKYRSRGLRLVVVSVMDQGMCATPDWTPDHVVCDEDGIMQDAWKADPLPQAFLWSWEGNLLVAHGAVEQVEKAVETYFKNEPRILITQPVDGAGKALRDAQEIRGLVRGELARSAKFDVVPDRKTAAELRRLKKEGHKVQYDQRLACEIGKEVSPNSQLNITVRKSGRKQRLYLELYSIEDGCLRMSARAPIHSRDIESAVVEAVDKLVSALSGKATSPGAGAKRPEPKTTPRPKIEPAVKVVQPAVTPPHQEKPRIKTVNLLHTIATRPLVKRRFTGSVGSRLDFLTQGTTEDPLSESDFSDIIALSVWVSFSPMDRLEVGIATKSDPMVAGGYAASFGYPGGAILRHSLAHTGPESDGITPDGVGGYTGISPVWAKYRLNNFLATHSELNLMLDDGVFGFRTGVDMRIAGNRSFTMIARAYFGSDFSFKYPHIPLEVETIWCPWRNFFISGKLGVVLAFWELDNPAYPYPSNGSWGNTFDLSSHKRKAGLGYLPHGGPGDLKDYIKYGFGVELVPFTLKLGYSIYQKWDLGLDFTVLNLASEGFSLVIGPFVDWHW